jgi:hypothetical protein
MASLSNPRFSFLLADLSVLLKLSIVPRSGDWAQPLARERHESVFLGCETLLVMTVSPLVFKMNKST